VSFVLEVKLRIKPEHVENFMAKLAENAKAARTEPGCLTFDVSVDPNDKTSVMLYEVYADEKALEAAGLKSDDTAGLLNYLRQRTLSDTDLTKIQAVIRRLGADDFEERLKAAREVESFGPAAVGPLRTASQSDPDYEVLYRAGECLKRMGKSRPCQLARIWIQ